MPLMQLQSWKPIVALRPFVDHFSLRKASLGSKEIYCPLPARNDCFLEFYLDDPYRVVDIASGTIHPAPRLVLVGPHARRREDLIYQGTLHVFHIGFTPTGFYSLFQIPANTIANLAESADVVLGPSIRGLEQQLASSPQNQWVLIAEKFLLRRCVCSKPAGGESFTARVARSLLVHRGNLPVSELAARHGRSVRQMERIFENQVGLHPKLFSRIARLQAALQISQQEPVPHWSAVALDAGYFDQSHMVRDFRALTGETPVGLRRLYGLRPSSTDGRMSHLSYPRVF